MTESGNPDSDAEFLAEVGAIVERAQARGIPVRACGAVGVYWAVQDDPDAVAIYRRRGAARGARGLFKDLDLVTLERYSSAVYKFFTREMAFREDRETNALFGSYRNIYFHPRFQVDLFFDKLSFSHEIPIKGRLLPGRALPPEDLLLSKLQIHDVTGKDLADVAALVSRYPVVSVDRGYLASLLGDDWGFWYDAHQNLGRAARELEATARDGPPERLARALGQLEDYRRFLAEVPKTRRWEKRARRGTQETWFEPVDEVR